MSCAYSKTKPYTGYIVVAGHIELPLIKCQLIRSVVRFVGDSGRSCFQYFVYTSTKD